MERDQSHYDVESDCQDFNSHAHVERDIVGNIYDTPELLNFNSHAHVERDVFGQKFRCRIEISTHTLTWSVTGAKLDDNAVIGISTHTLTWSVTSR